MKKRIFAMAIIASLLLSTFAITSCIQDEPTKVKAASAVSDWDPDTVYRYGDIVRYDGDYWVAWWYTQNTVPGSTGKMGVWRPYDKPIKEVDTPTPTPVPTPIPFRTPEPTQKPTIKPTTKPTEKPIVKSYNFQAVNQLKTSNDVPDPFKFVDGSTVKNPSDWKARASEISCMYEYYMYGMWRDGSDEEVSYKINGNKLNITIKRKSTGKTTSFPAVINLPKTVRHEGGAPVIVGMHSGIAESTATSQGYAVLTIDGTLFSNPVASDDTNHKGAFYDLYPYGNSWQDQTGVLMAWSWGCSKILDALYKGAGKELKINPNSSIVTGVSRWGKATAVCGAFDKRFKMSAPSCSGAGGLALYRYMSEGKTYDFSSKGASSSYRYGQNEPLSSLQSSGERGWFNNRFLEFKNPNQLPVDQHMLGSLVADPDRYLFIIGSCVSEDWVNAPSMWASYLGAKKVYDYLGISDNIAINIHKEGHAVLAEDINAMVAYFDYHVYNIKPNMDLKKLQTSVFAEPKNVDPFFNNFTKNWAH